MPNNRNLIDCLLSLQSSNHGVYFTLNSGPDDFLSYKDLIKSARSTLVHLHAKGLKKGDKLVFQLNNPINFIVTFWSCLFGGIVPVPVSVSSSNEGRNKLIRILEGLRDPWLITDGLSPDKQDSKDLLPGDLPDIPGLNHIFFHEITPDQGNPAEIESVDAEDIAFIQFSSGSTGLPKGAVLTHKNLLTNLSAITGALKMCKNTDPTCCWTPLTHDMGIVGGHLLSVYSYNSQNLISTNCFLKNPSVWLQKMSQYKITISSAPNFGFYYTTRYARHDILDQIDLSSVRHILNGAEPVSHKVCDTFNEKFQKYGLKKNAILPVYGMAEACLAVAFPELDKPIESWFINRNTLKKGQKAEFTDNTDDACFVSVGTAVQGCSIKISHEDKTPEDRIIGEILIKGDNVIQNYYGKSEPATDKDGWFNTGDLGFIEDGKLVITGRLKDIIFWNGQNIYPHDLERIAEQLEIVGAGKIVFGGNHRHDSGLEEVLAFLQYRGNIQSFMPIAKEIRKQISEKTGIQIKYVIPVRKIPKTTSGKTQRYLLVSGYQNGDYKDLTEQIDALYSMDHPDQATSSEDHLEEQLTSIWEEVLEFSPIGVHDNFFELGGDSIKAIRIGTKLQEYKFNCPPSMLFEKKTIKEMADFIRSFQDSSEQTSDDNENKEISEYSINQFSNEDLEDVFSKK